MWEKLPGQRTSFLGQNLLKSRENQLLDGLVPTLRNLIEFGVGFIDQGDSQHEINYSLQ